MSLQDGTAEKKSTFDAEVEPAETGGHTPAPLTPLSRKLKNRHVVMISFGGLTGTGMFLGTASALMNGGPVPVGMFLGYIFVGTICGHIKLAERFVDPAFAFALGWNLWYNWTVLFDFYHMLTFFDCLTYCSGINSVHVIFLFLDDFPAELSAAATVIDFWDHKVNNAVWITMCLVVAVSLNIFEVGVYGEAEFWFCSMKVITLTGMVILGIVLDFGGGPNHDLIGFQYWKNPGPFFSFDGIRGISLDAAEAKSPKNIYFRLLVFYIGGVFVIGLLVPSNNPMLNINSENVSAAPFVIAINQAGIKVLPSIVNAAILSSAWSASSSDLYIASRGLYGLAASRSAPKIFLRTTRSGLPYVSVAFCACFSLLAYMGIGSSSGMVFTWFSSMTANCGLATWFGTGVTYLRFYGGLRAQNFDRTWWTMCGSAITMFFSAWEVFLRDSDEWSKATFITNYLPIMLFPVLYVSAK
ncbi:amino acid-polyamine-Organocation superfamily protein [Tylopilus felleus]